MKKFLKLMSMFLLFGVFIASLVFIIRPSSFWNNPPVTLVRVNESHLEFLCFDNKDCPSNVNLMNMDEPNGIWISSAFYRNGNTLDFIIEYGLQKPILLELDLKNHREDYTPLPVEYGDNVANTDTQVIIGDYKWPLFFIQEGDMKKVNPVNWEPSQPTPILRLLLRENDLVVFSTNPLIDNEKTYAQIWLIDLKTLQISNQLLQLPDLSYFEISDTRELLQEGFKVVPFYVEGISEDLTSVFITYFSDTALGNAHTRLGSFDTSTLKRIGKADSNCFDRYFQNRGILYSSNFAGEGCTSAHFIKIKGFSSYDLSRFTNDESTSKLLIAPFGRNFIFGTNSKVFVVSPRGRILKKFDLPLAWQSKDYTIADYSDQ